MDSTEPERTHALRQRDAAALERRVRRAYEIERMQRAAAGFAPALLVPMVVFALQGVSSSSALLGVGLFAVGVLALWRGQAPARGVLPGLAAGIIPLAAALCAPRTHLCAGGQCMSTCVPICATGGLAAGVAIGVFARRRGAGAAFVGSASALALITGALGCTCVGLAGVLGMGAGFALGLAPVLVRRTARGGEA